MLSIFPNMPCLPTAAASDAPSIDCLPNELLAHVVHSIRGKERQSLLHGLLFVNRRFSSIAREELYYAPLLKPDYAHQLAARLLDEPRLANKVTELEIIKTDPEMARDWDWDSDTWKGRKFYGGGIFDPSTTALELASKCHQALLSRGIIDHSLRWMAGLQAGDSYAYIAVLLVITPRLERLLISSQFAHVLTKAHVALGRSYGTPSRPYMINTLNSIKLKIKDFNMAPVPLKKRGSFGHGPDGIQFWSLKSLDLGGMASVEYLTLPSYALGTVSQTAGYIMPRFPPNLHSLRITDCQLVTIQFLKEFLPHAKNRYPLLERIEATFQEERIGLVPGVGDMNREAEMQLVSRAAKDKGIKMHWNFQGRRVT